jgi:cytochrome c-type biogenesis protein CcmH/NrfG
MEVVFGVVLLALVATFVLRPLWREERDGGGEDPQVVDLEARKEVKYREIRDTELDHAAGKLSDEDFRRQNAELRDEAVEILKGLDELRGDAPQG